MGRAPPAPSPCSPAGSLGVMRPATTLTLGLLLLAILAAGIISLLRF